MGKVVITHIDEAPWIRENPREDGPRKLGTRLIGEEAQGIRAYITSLAPGFETPVHTHTQDEIIYVIEGSLLLGKRTLGPGSVLLIQQDTQYQFQAGEDGVRFMNTRPGPAEYRPIKPSGQAAPGDNPPSGQ